LGIPCLFVEGRNLDTTSFDMEQFRTHMESFVELCLDRKTSRSPA